eukprot:scaffold15975_cov65-Phaeocystis_antarctica.AAC.3
MMGVADESYTAARAAARREACAPVSDAFEAAAPSTLLLYKAADHAAKGVRLGMTLLLSRAAPVSGEVSPSRSHTP